MLLVYACTPFVPSRVSTSGDRDLMNAVMLAVHSGGGLISFPVSKASTAGSIPYYTPVYWFVCVKSSLM